MPIDDWPPLEPDPVIEAYKKDVDVTLLIENLKLTPEQRLRKMISVLSACEALRAAMRQARPTMKSNS
jgi:hypothetical protein